jgi:geranylgeranyl pyrophosphate synthase
MKKSGNILIKTGKRRLLPDESAHEGCAIEWWFTQGYYDRPRTGRRFFMASAFRHRPDSKAADFPYGYSLLLSVLDPKQGKTRSLSRLDPNSVDAAQRDTEDLKQVNLDKKLIEMYRREIRDHGTPSIFKVEKAPVRLASRPFSLTWKDFSISQSKEDFKLSFIEPEDGRRCSFRLVPVRPRMYIEGIGEPATLSMPYATYPSMKLAGKAGSESVKGQAWFDHQWGRSGAWAYTNTSRKRLTGWDWFGINLDDGSDLLLIVHRDMKNRRSISRCAIVRRPRKGPAVFRDFLIKPVAYWESPATQVTYPVSWRIVIPGIETDLVFRPLAEDQELRVFGIARSVWEGAGTVEGSVAGRPVTGRARLELHGYGYIFDARSYFGSFSKKIDACVESFFPRSIESNRLERFLGPPQWKHDASAYNETIARPVWDLMSRRGKQWRAIFNLLLLDSLGMPHGPYIDLASVIPELCHTGSLIIDDIEDNSKTRRGDMCIHLRYGLDVAINSGNTIYFLPFLLIAGHPGLNDAQRVKIYRIVFRAFARSHFGQALDIYWSKSMSRRNVSRWDEKSFGDKILQMYADKTSAFIEAAAESACIVAGADKMTRAACIRFARILGVAFQITDDVLNFSASPRWGKTSGEDLREGKTTYVIYRALKALEPGDGAHLEKILCTKRLRKDRSALQAGVELIKKSRVLEICREEAKTMVDDVWTDFSRRVPPSEAKTMLRLFASSLLEIVYES